MSRLRSSVVFANGAGFGNYGDDAIVRSIGSALATSGRACRFINFGGPDGHAAVEGLVPAVASYSSMDGHVGRLKGAAAIGSSRLLVVGGGGLLQDELPFFYRPFTRAAKLARIAAVPYAVVGVGVYPPNTSQFARDLREFAQNAARISVRDPSSLEVLRKLGVDRPIEVVPDPAFAYPFESTRTAHAAGVRVGIALRPWWHLPEMWETPDPGRLQRLVERVAEALSVLHQDVGVECRLITMHIGTDDDDSDVANALRAALDRLKVPCSLAPSRSAQEIAREISGCSLILGMRLHSLILGAAQGIPTVGLNYDSKVAMMMESLGRAQDVFPLEGYSADELAAGLVRALDAGVSAEEQAVVSALRARALAELRAVTALV